MSSVWKKNNRLRVRTSDEFHYARLKEFISGEEPDHGCTDIKPLLSLLLILLL